MVNVIILNTTMFTFFNTLSCGFECKCLAFIWAFIHVKTSTGPTHNPFALFHQKRWGRIRLTPFGFPTPNGCWFLLLWILLCGHCDGKLTKFHHTKSLINLFHNVECFFKWGITPWLSVEVLPSFPPFCPI
jgi:hypothetical protein